jgi:hypothetical protein
MQYPDDANYRLDISQIVSSGLVKHAFNVVNAGTAYNNNLVLDRGNVGIGTTSPARLLHILAPTGNHAYQRIEGGSGGYGGFLELMANSVGSDTDSAGKVDFYMTSTNRIATIDAKRTAGGANYGTLIFSTADNATTPTERMRITSGGNIGIGTASPATRLQVDAASATTSSTVLTINGSATGFAAANDANTGYSINFDGCAFTGSTGIVSRTGAQIEMLKNGSWNQAAAGQGTNASLIFKTNSGTIESPNLAERMRITSGGNVGIGLTDPSDRLDINGSIRFRANTPNFTAAIDNAVIDYVPTSIFPTNPGIRIAAIGTASIGAEIRLLTGTSTTLAERLRVTDNGLTFNGDTAAANALDDYEEGTWTPGIAFDGNSVGVTYLVREASYTKIARQVTATGVFVLTSKGSSTGQVTITGLPFSIPNELNKFSSASVRCIGVSFANQFQAEGVINTTTILLSETTEAGITTNLTQSDIANDANIIVTLTYFV